MAGGGGGGGSSSDAAVVAVLALGSVAAARTDVTEKEARSASQPLSFELRGEADSSEEEIGELT
ncbi:unnamed protein product [Gongylonema pulchrum]|uniref:Uncharacterized protein n=1 Tax=Gongylonema pulchrum TaxID=637853 RepID=A0A183D1S5_9BILA|nr:unnamed protein product [Gongylonema pulchrum]